jgi:hypothetical protein
VAPLLVLPAIEMCWGLSLTPSHPSRLSHTVAPHVPQKYRDAAMIELEALATLAANDPTQSAHCVRLLEWFDYRGHVCMVFERLGPSLYDVLRRNGYKPFPLPMVRCLHRIGRCPAGGGSRKPQAAARNSSRRQHMAAPPCCWLCMLPPAARTQRRLPSGFPAALLPGRSRPSPGSCWRAWHSCMSTRLCTLT